jgi:hypothetical protein
MTRQSSICATVWRQWKKFAPPVVLHTYTYREKEPFESAH